MHRNSAPAPPASRGERLLRTGLAALFFFGAAGTAAELFLLGHFEEPVQFAPFAAMLLAGSAVAWALATSQRRALRAARWSMVLLGVVGVVGVVLHYRSNAGLEVEMDAGIGGLRLAWLAIRGATPALAPGQLVQLGLIGFLFTFAHPALRPNGRGEDGPQPIPTRPEGPPS